MKKYILLFFALGIIISFLFGRLCSSYYLAEKYKKKYELVNKNIIVADKYIVEGETISENSIKSIPMYKVYDLANIDAVFEKELIGKKAACTFNRGEALTWSILRPVITRNEFVDK